MFRRSFALCLIPALCFSASGCGLTDETDSATDSESSTTGASTADAQRGIADRFALALPECFGFGVERRSKATPPPRGKRPAGSGVRSPVI